MSEQCQFASTIVVLDMVCLHTSLGEFTDVCGRSSFQGPTRAGYTGFHGPGVTRPGLLDRP